MKEIIMILAAYCLNYPILCELGLTLNQPIALVADEIDNAVTVAKQISQFPVLVDSAMKISHVKEEIRMAYSRGVFGERRSNMPGTHKQSTIAFRPSSSWQAALINERCKLSGMNKKDFICRSKIYSNICVVGKKETVQVVGDSLQEMEQN